jgi:hypothetical protein
VSVNLYLDDDTGLLALPPQARAVGIEAFRSDDLGMRGASDEQHLEFATARNLVLVTCNRRDFLRLHYDSLARERAHSGMILVHQDIPPGERVRRLLLLASVADPSDMHFRIEWLKDWA